MSQIIPAEHAAHEVENGFRQFDYCLELIDYYLDKERPFALRSGTIRDLQKIAVDGVEGRPGEYRTSPVGITHSPHTPPREYLVSPLVEELCDYVNDNWHEKSAFHLSAYVMWRLNWIHPFADGNGRTSRTLSYLLLCLKLGYRLPGSPTIPAQIEEDKAHYLQALQACDHSAIDGQEDISSMEEMIRGMLARQLIGVVEEAQGGVEIDLTRGQPT